jgi:hypothetical protein
LNLIRNRVQGQPEPEIVRQPRGCRRVIMKGDDMGFLLGFFMGLLAAIGGFAFLAYWLCNRTNNVAAAKFMIGCAQALAHRPKSSAPLPPAENGEATALARRARKEETAEGWG